MSNSNHYKPVTILLVDDDVDYIAVQRVMKRLRLLNPLVRAGWAGSANYSHQYGDHKRRLFDLA